VEIIKLQIKGIYRDELTDAAGQLIYQSDWKSNTIVESCRIFLAKVMKNGGQAFSGELGIQSLQVGRGNDNWDEPNGTPPPTETQKSLVDLVPVEITDLSIGYLNPSDQPVSDPTHRIQIQATLKAGDPPGVTSYPLREFGLVGRFGNDKYLLNYVTHPVIHKDQLTTLTRTIRLYF
jgi:hypothetical protein